MSTDLLIEAAKIKREWPELCALQVINRASNDQNAHRNGRHRFRHD